jgi:hypothetical protein
MCAWIALYLTLASADRLLEATVREAAMSSPEWWEAHHQLAKLKPGTSWFGPIGRAIARDIAKRYYTRSCALGDAVVLGSGFSKTPYWLARTGAFRRVYGIDSSISAVRAMSRYAKALDHGGRGWDIVRYVRADLTRPGQFRSNASLVLDEGVLDVLQAGPGIDARQVMNAYVERAAGLVRQGGALIVVGYAGNPAVVNQTTLELSCWTRSGFLGLDALGADPRRACSPWGPGAYVLTRRRVADDRAKIV